MFLNVEFDQETQDQNTSYKGISLMTFHKAAVKIRLEFHQITHKIKRWLHHYSCFNYSIIIVISIMTHQKINVISPLP